jgi:hypothetical protein
MVRSVEINWFIGSVRRREREISKPFRGYSVPTSDWVKGPGQSFGAVYVAFTKL